MLRLNLAAGIERLAQDYQLIQQSPWYRSPALGFEGPEFINLVVEIQLKDDFSPEAAVAAIKTNRNRFWSRC